MEAWSGVTSGCHGLSKFLAFICCRVIPHFFSKSNMSSSQIPLSTSNFARADMEERSRLPPAWP